MRQPKVMTHPNQDVEFVLITPAIAEEMLAHNHSNRRLRPTVVARYARDMREGQWRLKGQMPILIDTKGDLVNGQHRLSACIQAGVAFPAYIIHDASPEDQIVTDSGLGRSLADVFGWQGYAKPARLAAVVRTGYLYERRLFGSKNFGRAPTRQEGLEWVAAHPGILDSMEAVEDLTMKLRLGIGPIAYIHWYGMKHFPEKTAEFFDQLRHGINLKQGDPALAMRNRLTERFFPGGGERLLFMMAILIKTFNAHVQGKPMIRVRFNYRNTKNQEPFPRLVGDE